MVATVTRFMAMSGSVISSSGSKSALRLPAVSHAVVVRRDLSRWHGIVGVLVRNDDVF